MYFDLLTKIRNAQAAGKKSLKTRFTKMDNAISDLLVSSKFLKKTEIKGRMPKRIIELELNPERPITGLKILSRPSRRLYAGYKDFRSVKGGHGLVVISTSKGILSGNQAKREKVGGQLLFEIW